MKFLFLLIVFFCKNVFRMKKKFLKVDYILFIFEKKFVSILFCLNNIWYIWLLKDYLFFLLCLLVFVKYRYIF